MKSITSKRITKIIIAIFFAMITNYSHAQISCKNYETITQQSNYRGFILRLGTQQVIIVPLDKDKNCISLLSGGYLNNRLHPRIGEMPPYGIGFFSEKLAAAICATESIEPSYNAFSCPSSRVKVQNNTRIAIPDIPSGQNFLLSRLVGEDVKSITGVLLDENEFLSAELPFETILSVCSDNTEATNKNSMKTVFGPLFDYLEKPAFDILVCGVNYLIIDKKNKRVQGSSYGVPINRELLIDKLETHPSFGLADKQGKHLRRLFASLCVGNDKFEHSVAKILISRFSAKQALPEFPAAGLYVRCI